MITEPWNKLSLDSAANQPPLERVLTGECRKEDYSRISQSYDLVVPLDSSRSGVLRLSNFPAK